ncbi:MAG: hypothetical protein ABH837_02855 [bacterium]
MEISFVLKDHSLKPGQKVVEILAGGKVVAVIYPDDAGGIKLVSAHISDVVHEDESREFPPIPTIHVRFDPRPYTIKNGKIEKPRGEKMNGFGATGLPDEDPGKSDQTKETLCQTCKVKPGTPRIDNGLPCGDHCDECWEKLVRDARSKSW